jgi:steroid 5-alpha reductase family enzyme
MPLLQSLLHATAFRTPLLRTLVPSVALAYGIQTAVAVPSIAAQTERFYDLSGSVTYISCTALSFFMPYLRAKSTGAFAGGLSEYLSAPAPGQALWWWRHAMLSAAVGIWATRCMSSARILLDSKKLTITVGSFLFKRITEDQGTDSRFDNIRTSPAKFLVAFFAQATWVSLCTLPVLLVNSLPRSAFALSRLAKVTSAVPPVVSAKPYPVELVGLAIFVFGLTFEVIADRQKSQWSKEKKEKKHSEEFLTRGLWSKSRHPNYFGEITLWSGIAIAASGLLLRQPAQSALGLSGASGKMLVAGMCAASPAFVAFLLLKVSGIPLSENKYDKKFGDRKDYKKWKEETPMLIPKF